MLEIEGDVAGAMLMAVCVRGMTDTETASLTEAMIKSGSRLHYPSDWSGLIVGKHSTGGVGDKVSIVLVPALAACGLKVGQVTLCVKACPHWFPKQDTLYPETGDFVSGNRRFCSKNATKSPVSGYKVAVSGNKFACFRIRSHLFPDTKSPVSGTSVDRPL